VRNIGKAAMLIIITTILILLMGKTVWACQMKNCKPVAGGIHCKLKCTDYQAKSTGIGRIMLFGGPGVTLDPDLNNPPKPDPENPPKQPHKWFVDRFQTGENSFGLNLVPVPPILEGESWEISFKTTYKEIEAIVAEIREAGSDHLKERFHLEKE
jgi:hypothetical protein